MSAAERARLGLPEDPYAGPMDEVGLALLVIGTLVVVAAVVMMPPSGPSRWHRAFRAGVAAFALGLGVMAWEVIDLLGYMAAT